ncbi:MAG: ferrodoxin oxidoreductase beta subunit [Arcobacter sp.]|nr:MAG: ferrodoxin oxidoreductase beta subunit [Arcobacter sp.]
MYKLFFLLIISIGLQADMFVQGSKSVGLKLGSASIGNEDYTIAGITGNYFIADSLSIGLGYEKWFSGDPDISKVTLETTYFIRATDTVRPYGGLIYRRILISGSDFFGRSYDDTNSYGGRAGLAFVKDNLLLSAGLVYERYDSTQRLFDDSETYVELTIGFVF